MFELLELGTPDWVINSHVELAKELVRPEAARLVNGALTSATSHAISKQCQQTRCQLCSFTFVRWFERIALVVNPDGVWQGF